MWESPINAIYEAQKNTFDDAVFSAVMKVGIDVNREELIKALAYDRQQYEKGYADAKAEIVRCMDCKWFDIDMERCNGGEHPTMPDAFCSWAERRDDAE